MRSSHALILVIVLALVAIGVIVTVLSDSPESEAAVLGRREGAAAPAVPAELEGPAPEVVEEAGTSPVAPTPDRRQAQRSGTLANRGERELRWVEGTLLLPREAEWDETARVLSVAAPERERPTRALFGMMSGEAGRPSEETEVLYTAAVQPDGTFRVAAAPDAEWAYLEIDGRFLYLPAPQALRIQGDVTHVELAPLVGACIRGRWIAPPDASDDERAGYLGTAHLAVPAREDFPPFLMGEGEEGIPMFHRVPTAVDGTFEMRGVDPNPEWVLVSTPPNFASQVTEEIELTPGEVFEVEIELTRGTLLAGRVIERRGDPVVGARVDATVGDEETEFSRTRLLSRWAVTKEDGTFSIQGLSPGEVRVRAEKDGYRRGVRKKYELEAGEAVTDIELKLRRGEALRGFVTWTDGTPAVRAALHVGRDATGRTEPLEATARTLYGEYEADERGRFEITGLKRRAQSLWAFATRSDGGIMVEGVAQKDGVEPDDEEEHDLVLESVPLLAGVVKDPSGEPVPRFRLVVRPDEGAGSMFSAMTAVRSAVERDIESADGTFLLERIGAGEFAVTIEAEGFALSTPLGVELPPARGTAPLEIVLEPYASVSGVVLSPSGDPVSGAEVIAAPIELESIDRMLAETSGPARVVANARGEFAFTQLEPGELTLRAEGDPVPSERVRIELVPGEERLGLVLALRVGSHLTGEAFKGDGSPLAGRKVSVTVHEDTTASPGWWGGQRNAESTITDANGWFELEGLAPGRALVSLEPTDEEMQEARDGEVDWWAVMATRLRKNIELFDRETTHVLLGGAVEIESDPVTVSGRVTLRGEPVAGTVAFTLDAVQVSSGTSEATLDDGEFEVELGVPGEYRIRVDQKLGGEEWTTAMLYRRVPNTDRHVLDLALPGARIAGRVYDFEGEPAPGIPVTIRAVGPRSTENDPGSMFGGEETEPDGSYEFTELEPGTYVVGAGSPMLSMFVGGAAGYGRTTTRPIELAQDEDRGGVDIALRKPGELSGRVVDTDGEPLNGASIFVYDSAGVPVDVMSTTTTNAGGRFRYEGLAEGTYSVLARTKSHATSISRPARVGAESSDEVELVAHQGAHLLVTLHDAAGEPLRANISVTDEEGREVQGLAGFGSFFGAWSDDSGSRTRRVGPVSPGSYRVVARSTDGAEVVRRVDVRGGREELTVDLALDP